nr:hypothetical protein [Polymorphobacter sp.]
MATTWAAPAPHAAPKPAIRTGSPIAARIAAVLLALATLGLFARIMAYPLRHDEQMYLPVGALLSDGALYQDYGFNNLPNLPLLLHLVFTGSGTEHYLLTGRLVIFAGWLLAALAMALIVHRATGSGTAVVLAVLALFTSPPLLGPAGMTVTNNFLPIPFALLGTHFFIAGLDRPHPHRAALVISGLCLAVAAGFKANYIFLAPPFAIAALLLPRHLPVAHRLTTVILPLTLGAIVGALPLLILAAPDPDAFIAHVLNYHRGPHMAYWQANPSVDGPKIMSLGGKVQLAESIWFGGATLLILLSCACLAFAGGLRRDAAKPLWPVLLVAALTLGAALVSFVPTPAFPQYYVAPIPFGIALTALLYGRLDPHRRAAAAPFLQAAAALMLLLGAPRLLADLPQLARPSHWAGNQAHAAGHDIAAAMNAVGPLATLAPLYALEAGQKIYPELAAGPLVYRVGDLIPQHDRRYYRMVSPTTIGALLAANPPAAILIGYEGDLDTPLKAFAVAHGYRPVTFPSLHTRNGDGILYVRPPHG